MLVVTDDQASSDFQVSNQFCIKTGSILPPSSDGFAPYCPIYPPTSRIVVIILTPASNTMYPSAHQT